MKRVRLSDADRDAERLFWKRFEAQPSPNESVEPSRAALAKHERRFGSECVKEIAVYYTIDAKARPAPKVRAKRQRRTTPKLKAEFARLYFEERLVLAAVADTLNVSDRRAKLLRKELEAEGWLRAAPSKSGAAAKPQKNPRNHAGLRGQKRRSGTRPHSGRFGAQERQP